MAQEKSSKKTREKKTEFKAEWRQPLRWLEGWPRTRFQDREDMKSWKGTLADYRAALDGELRRLGVLSAVVSTNHGLDSAHFDSGVTIYFTRKELDYSWQEALGFVGILPSLDEIKAKYRQLAAIYHDEGKTPNLEMFHAITKHRDNAIAMVTGTYQRPLESGIACDQYKDIRWNVYALKETLRSIRRMDEFGCSVVVDAILDSNALKRKMIGAGNAKT